MTDPYQPGAQQPSQPQQPQPGYSQQGYPQQGYPYPPAGYPYPGYAPEPPGRTLGIVGFVLAFVVAPAGIVLSAMALSESKKAGARNPLGTWGLWLSIAFTAAGVLYVLFIMLFVFGGLFTAFSTTPTLSGTGSI